MTDKLINAEKLKARMREVHSALSAEFDLPATTADRKHEINGGLKFARDLLMDIDRMPAEVAKVESD